MEQISPTRRQLLAASVASAGLLGTRLPGSTSAQEATPLAVDPGDDGSLLSMLSRAYDPIPDGGSGPTSLVSYANIARQLEVRGLRMPDPGFQDRDRTSEWIDGIDGLYPDDVLAQRSMLDELWAMLGFDPTHVDQTLTIGDPPGITRIYRGRFDGRAIVRALEATGYERGETDRGPVMTIGPDAEFSADNPIQVLVINAYNNIAVVDDSYVIASPFIIGVKAALAVFDGTQGTLANNRAVATLMAAVREELVSATILDGAVLSVANLPARATEGLATPMPVETIPPAVYVLFGLTRGSMPSRYSDEDTQLQGDHDDTAPRSVVVMAVHLGSDEEAVAAATVIDKRLAEARSVLTGELYSTLFDQWEVAAVSGTPVVKVRISGDRIIRRWLQLVFAQDFVFLYTA